MKLVVAADSFKGSLSSKQIGEIFVNAAGCGVTILPVEIADGGEGTLDAVVASGKFTPVTVECTGPLFDRVSAQYGIGENKAFVEMAQASGLTLIPYRDGNALRTTTYGTGELIAAAIKGGARKISVSVGGSATNDGGIGALAALGYKFLDENGQILQPIGENLIKIANIDGSQALNTDGIEFTVLTDVDNPLVGETGATRFYGRQKGAVGDGMELLECGMINYARVVERFTGVKLGDMRGAGAAGGLAGGLVAFLGAKIVSGIEAVLDLIGFDELITGASAVITGEGCIDDQSAHGKAISGVCGRAKKQNIPVYAMVGGSKISDEGKALLGLTAVYPISKYAQNVQDSIKNAAKYAEITAKSILTEIIGGENDE